MLERNGMRYGFCNGEYRWRHYLELPEGFIDCTDMDDAEFERFVHEHPQSENAR